MGFHDVRRWTRLLELQRATLVADLDQRYWLIQSARSHIETLHRTPSAGLDSGLTALAGDLEQLAALVKAERGWLHDMETTIQSMDSQTASTSSPGGEGR